ncbi:MAG: DUF2934 domain-containing protein [Bryobacteraceae bacterium]
MPANAAPRSRRRNRHSAGETAVTPVPIPPAAEGTPNECGVEPEEIARLAHSYWESRGGQGGSPEEDWFRAEQELKARRAAKQ